MAELALPLVFGLKTILIGALGTGWFAPLRAMAVTLTLTLPFAGWLLSVTVTKTLATEGAAPTKLTVDVLLVTPRDVAVIWKLPATVLVNVVEKLPPEFVVPLAAAKIAEPDVDVKVISTPLNGVFSAVTYHNI